MSETPQSLDEILASIRRIVSNGGPPPVALPDPPPEAPEAPAGASAPDAPHVCPPSLDSTIRAMLEPQLKTWLDANLPEIVERTVQAEVRRLTRG